MTFDEFFKKKRIDLAALQQAEAALFSEFKDHFEQMGDKSFDHSKKYWFNKLRRQFPLAPEIKTEKPHAANPIAEQTINESLSETAPAAPAPKLGFAPKFKAGISKSAATPTPNEEEKNAEIPAPAQPENEEAKTTTYVPKFKPKLKTEDTPPIVPKPDKTTEVHEAKPAYTPKFKMQFKPKAEEPAAETLIPEKETNTGNNTDGLLPEGQPEVKPAAYKPKFKMQFKPKPDTE